MKKLLLATYMVSCLTATVFGQEEILYKFNEIKEHSDLYYWNEYSHTDADSAAINSARWVLIEINCTLPEGSELTLDDIMPRMKCLTRKRGRKTHALSYLRKDEVHGMSHVQAPANENVSTVETRMKRNSETKEFVPDFFAQRIIRQKDFLKVYQYLKEQKNEGYILQFGPLKDVDDYSSLDLILFDMESKEIVAMLSQESESGVRINQLNGNVDSLDNYPEDMLLVIWYIK